MGKPTFLVVGAQKSGTTWLSECLTEHPEIFVPRAKEVHYFLHREDDRLSQRERGVDWYASQFPDAGFKATGELTPDYMFFPYVAKELAAYNADLRIVFLLREPVDRAYSAYRMKSRNNELAPFREEVRRSPAILERGLYYRQIERFLAFFPKEQVRVYIYEEATSAPDAFIADVFAFLGVDPSFRPKSLGKRVGETKALPRWASFLVYKVASPVINLPGIKNVWRFMRGRTRIKERIAGLLDSLSGRGKGPQGPTAGDRAEFAAYFDEENRRLAEFLGRNNIRAWQRH